MKTNTEILNERQTAFNKIQGPRVGDYLYIPSTDKRVPEYTRFTHDWTDSIQTGGLGGSFYMGESGGLGYSGGLDPGVKTADLTLTAATKEGSVWFFDKGRVGAGRGRTFNIPMRVYTLKKGADLNGIYHISCPYYLTALTPDIHANTCGYWYTITNHATPHTAFKTKEELTAWLYENKLALTQDLPEEKGVFMGQRLKYITEVQPCLK